MISKVFIVLRDAKYLVPLRGFEPAQLCCAFKKGGGSNPDKL